MKLIKEIPTEKCSGYWRKMGLFLCPKCNSETKKQYRIGAKQNTCGCRDDLSGDTINGVRIIRDIGGRRRRVVAECPACKKEWEVYAQSIKSGASRSCGCVIYRNIKHGMANSRIYFIHNGIIQRCFNKNSPAYRQYGAKGVRVCKEWLDFESFYEWAKQNGYKESLSIDRIDPYGNYEPHNCRWVNTVIQARNTRQCGKNNTSGYKGVSWDKQRRKWIAKITVNYTNINLGGYKTKLEAVQEYNKFIIENKLEHTLNKV